MMTAHLAYCLVEKIAPLAEVASVTKAYRGRPMSTFTKVHTGQFSALENNNTEFNR